MDNLLKFLAIHKETRYIFIYSELKVPVFYRLKDTCKTPTYIADF